MPSETEYKTVALMTERGATAVRVHSYIQNRDYEILEFYDFMDFVFYVGSGIDPFEEERETQTRERKRQKLLATT